MTQSCGWRWGCEETWLTLTASAGPGPAPVVAAWSGSGGAGAWETPHHVSEELNEEILGAL